MKSRNCLFETIVAPGVEFLNTAKIVNSKGCFIENERKRHPVLVIKGGVDETKVRIPRDEQFLSPLGICDHLLVLQLRLPPLNHFALELIITHEVSSRMKLIIGTHFTETRCNKTINRMLVAMLPLTITRNQWVQVVFHIKGIVDNIFNLPPFNFIDSVSFCGNAKIGMLMSTSNEELCLQHGRTKMAMSLVPAYAPPVWSTSSSAHNTNVPRVVPCLSDLQYQKSDTKDLLKEIIPNISSRGFVDSKISTSRILSPLPETSQVCLASSGNQMSSPTSDSFYSSELKRLPAITGFYDSNKTSKYFRMIDSDDSAYSPHNKQNCLTLLKRGPHPILPKDTVDPCAGKTTILCGKQSTETSTENPFTSWVSDMQLCDKDTVRGLVRVSEKKDSNMPKAQLTKEKGACISGNPFQPSTISRKGRPLRNNDRCGDVESSLPNPKKKKRVKNRMRLPRQNKTKIPKGAPEQKLASEVLIRSVSSSSESPQVDGSPCGLFCMPKVGYGVGYLGVINEEGEYIDEDGVNVRLRKNLAFRLSDDDE
ncbi:unnamed protein product [Phytomonas sp. Hart1]|nr:unnamed protein product [Phytomonas sp. Hart1]|eukprot:CCW72045.1 unnamed protein product [Phytomonas sp. isolate Hart1]